MAGYRDHHGALVVSNVCCGERLVVEVVPVTGAVLASPVVRVRQGQVLPQEEDTLAVEEPLEICLAWNEKGIAQHAVLTVTMRTPGNDRELVAGLLWSEGIVREPAQLVGLEKSDNPNSVTAHLAPGHQLDMKRYQRHFYSTSSCGVCGKMAIESLRLLCDPCLQAGWPLLPATAVLQLPEALLSAQTLFQQTGGVHAAALFNTAGELLLVREDIGRHNAVDKLLGACFLGQEHLSETVQPAGSVLAVSGRAGFELVQKALAANIAVMVAVGAPTSLAVQMAQAYNMTLVGFVKKQGFNIYSAPERIR